MTNISQSFYLGAYKTAAKISWHRYGTKTYITVTLCIRARHFSFPTTGGMTQATQIWAVSSK